MSERKNSADRSYPPDFVSAETLAYRLDCSRSTIDEYVRAGLLPKPEVIGNLKRWDFEEVRKYIKSCKLAISPITSDPYFDGVNLAENSQT